MIIKGIDWDAVDLGQRSDVEIAREYGVAVQVVWTARTRRGVAPCKPRSRVTPVPWHTAGLGERPDSAVALDLGLPRRSVATERSRRGIPPFIGLVLRQDGLPCRSIYEAMYDAVLHDRGVDHEHEVPFPTLGVIADLVVGGVATEITGMTGFARYDARLTRKREAYVAGGVEVMWLSSNDVVREYRTCSRQVLYRPRTCSACGEPVRALVKGTCRPCRLKAWRVENSTPRTCEQCQESYDAPAGAPSSTYCSRRCYWASMELSWPSWEEVDALLATRSVAATASEIGVKPATLAMRLHRRRKRTEKAVS